MNPTEHDSGTISAHTYEAELYAPLFYASREGSVIETDPIIAATALMHALGYEYYDFGKAFALAGEAATSADYSRLCELPFFTSEMVPTRNHSVTERTFRTVAYTTERAVVSQDSGVGQYIRGTKKPIPRQLEGSNAGWHKMRDYVGIAPGTRFTFTVWSPLAEAPPEQLGFRVGIKRTGEIRAERRNTPVDTVTVNQYLLQSVYEVGEDTIFDIMDRATDYKRGNDMRTSRFVGVDAGWFADEVLPSVIDL